MAIVMHASGISGSVNAKKHQNWMALNSLQFHASTFVNTPSGQTIDRVNGRPLVGEVAITKQADNSTIDWFSHVLGQKCIPEVTIELYADEDRDTPYFQYKLSDVLVSSYREVVDAHSVLPLEYFSLNFTRIEKRYTPRDAQNRPHSPKSCGYSLTTSSLL